VDVVFRVRGRTGMTGYVDGTDRPTNRRTASKTRRRGRFVVDDVQYVQKSSSSSITYVQYVFQKKAVDPVLSCGGVGWPLDDLKK